jgi:hypothetical protein
MTFIFFQKKEEGRQVEAKDEIEVKKNEVTPIV